MKHAMTIAMLGSEISIMSAQILGMNSPTSMSQLDCDIICDMKKRMADKCTEMASLIADMEDPKPINLYGQSFNDQLEAMRKKYHEESV
ncbi:MAG: hypothetical protein ACRCXB_15020 [Aeromonadaceae bacterium]